MSTPDVGAAPVSVQALLQTDQVGDYLARLRQQLADLPDEERNHLVSYARAQIELEMELAGPFASGEELARGVLARLGTPEALAGRLRPTVPAEEPEALEEQPASLVPCRACQREISREAYMCPHCGAPFPARKLAPASGYEWKSSTTIFGWPLIHVAFGRDKNGKLRVAKGVIAIGQFGIGAVTFAQFGIGLVFGIGQFMLAPLALGQFALGLAAAGQFGIGLVAGAGQFATGHWVAGLLKWKIW